MDSVTALPKVSDARVNCVANVPKFGIGATSRSREPESTQNLFLLAARATDIRCKTAAMVLQRESSL